MNEIIAPNIKRVIEEKCLKQASIAKQAGYTVQQFSAMVNGRKLVKDTDIDKIATALNVDTNELFKKEGD